MSLNLVDLDAGFFELGGANLTAMRVVPDLAKVGVDVDLATTFAHSTARYRQQGAAEERGRAAGASAVLRGFRVLSEVERDRTSQKDTRLVIIFWLEAANYGAKARV